MKQANFVQKNILILCTIQDLLLREQGNVLCIYDLGKVKYHIQNFVIHFTTTTTEAEFVGMGRLVMVPLKAETITCQKHFSYDLLFFLKVTTPGEKTQSHSGFI